MAHPASIAVIDLAPKRRNAQRLSPVAGIGGVMDGQGFYLEDMHLIQRQGAEVLTPAVPKAARMIDGALAGKGVKGPTNRQR